MTAIAGRFWSYTTSFQGNPVVYNFRRALPGLDSALEANRLGMHRRYSYIRGHIFIGCQSIGLQLWTATETVEFSLLSCSEELEERIERIEIEIKFVNDPFDHLQENNGKLAIENEDIKKNLALAEERQKWYSTPGSLQKRS
ncbi:hypothetical protein FVEG_09264 [Fusarium verticillioides 7600]|uniref:Uncharacterized protein n=1 Tax=Gibberella moniliformis (strain M3125 / FGSC 7600) TaxID=334819 RepID=W7MGB6_GIBM7|nr:hypothetical protein FVEG_09264 [Fusarium verticillioides 7600]EWG49901.1 hypothetical protein FVEG_09264 [Fusarium verticillioides 7600]